MSTTHIGPGATAMRLPEADARRFGTRLLGVFLLLAALVAWAGFLYLSHQQALARAQANRELSAIADLKLRQLLNWRAERLLDARFFAHARFVARDVRQFLDDPGSEPARAELLDWLTLLKNDGRYDAVMLFDSQFQPRLALPASAAEPQASVRDLLQTSLRAHDLVLTDLHRDPPSPSVHIDIALPIFQDAQAQRGSPLALLLLKLDARRFLFPLLQSWPAPSPTAETLLVRRQGQEVLYLNDLRFSVASALVLQKPLALPDLPAAKVLQGETNVFEGIDYRGVRVLAAGRLVPGTPWALVAKVDRAEVYAPLRHQFLADAFVLGLLLLAGALLLALLWRQRNAQFLQSQLAERQAHERAIQRMNRLYAALSQVNQAVVRARSREELLRRMCHVLVQFGGLHLAWVGWTDHASSRVLPLAQCGDQTYLEKVEAFADERPEGRGPVGTAIREGRPCVCNDVAADPVARSWREAVAQSGWGALAAFPLRQEGQVSGALAVYSREKNFFGPEEQALIEEAATDVSFGLDSLLTEQRRQQADEALRLARDELAGANAALERKVAERTAQLVEANTNLQAFAHTVAHDLRSPLRSISGFSSILLDQCAPLLGAQAKAMLEQVAAAASQMGRLLEDLLEYSTMSHAELQLQPVSLQAAVDEVLKLLEGEIRAKNAAVTLAGPLPQVLGHHATIVLLINNLLSNALKFIAPGVQPHVRLWAQPSTLNHQPSTIFYVEDNGIGIAPQDQEKIFGAFQRLHAKGTFPGTGLGLAIVRRAAERMGGRVGVESAPGKSSRFWVELPAALSAPP